MMGAIAQFETEIRVERQMEGFRNARERGVDFGRKRKLTMPQVTELRHRRKHDVLIKTLMNDNGLSKASVYRALPVLRNNSIFVAQDVMSPNSDTRIGWERGRLRKAGQVIGDFDLLIAVTGLHYGLTVLTNNRMHVERVEGLQTESI